MNAPNHQWIINEIIPATDPGNEREIDGGGIKGGNGNSIDFEIEGNESSNGCHSVTTSQRAIIDKI